MTSPERVRLAAGADEPVPAAGSVDPGTSRRWWPWPFLLACVAVGMLLLVTVLLTAGGAPRPVPPPLPDPGALTGWALPLARLLAGTGIVLAVGLLLAVALLLPVADGQLSATGRTATRSAAWAATAAAVAVAAQGVFTLSNLLAVRASKTLDVGLWTAFVVHSTVGAALATQLVLTCLVVAVAAGARTVLAAVVALLAALGAAVLPAVGSHAATAADHVLALVSLGVHLLAVTLWVGGLAGLALLALPGSPALGAAVRRFSSLALCCAGAVGVSGVVTAATRLEDVRAVVGSAYGRVVLAKAAAFGMLVALGWWHRRRTVPAFSRTGGASARSAFVRLAAVELLVMAGVYGVAVGLAHTPPPDEQLPLLRGRTPTEALLGYPLPEPPTLGTLLGTWYPDAFGLLVALTAVPLYLAAVRVLRRRGDTWPARRTATWLAGVTAVLVVTCTGVGRYAPALFSVHMVQHMTLNMVAPLLLVLGAPVTLALRALPLRDRRVLLAALRSPPVRFVALPLVTTGIFAGSLYLLYFTPLFEAAMRHHWGHLLMQAHFLASGFLFFWLVLGIDPGPSPPAKLLRVPLLLAVMLAHTVFSMVLVFGVFVVGEGYYTQLAPPWAPPLLDEQARGGAVAWVLGELITVCVLAAVILQWFNAAERADRAAARVRARRAPAPDRNTAVD